jgi:hypothetical protein
VGGHEQRALTGSLAEEHGLGRATPDGESGPGIAKRRQSKTNQTKTTRTTPGSYIGQDVEGTSGIISSCLNAIITVLTATGIRAAELAAIRYDPLSQGRDKGSYADLGVIPTTGQSALLKRQSVQYFGG